MRTSHYWRLASKAGTITTSRDAILQVFAIRAKTAKEGKKNLSSKMRGEH